MLSGQMRREFLRYFKEKGHALAPSSPVIPHDDPTLLFNNAGMNQFKDVFLGKSQRDYVRAASSQKCIRAGGKHNDLENVGHTSRHLTFFEMLGNFSFGDYFKEEAIHFAWEVSTKIFGFDPDRIYPTVYKDDDAAFEIWTKYVPKEKITRLGEKDNFWAMGDTGPCGPCSELLYDRGPRFGDAKSPAEDASGERFLEFWNLVFMQYNKTAEGALEPLPKPSVDTGAGLERVVALKMGIENVFETDILGSLIKKVEEVSGVAYHPEDESRAPAFCVIADHLRTLAFAIGDGAQPSNADRGYVLRKVLRRAVRYGKLLGFEEPFLAKILPALIDAMGEDYPELKKARARIAEILTIEEEAFFKTLRRGGNLLGQVVERAKTHHQVISGDDAFKLKDTYGLPFEEIVLIATDAGLSVDQKRYQELEKKAKERSKAAHKTSGQAVSENLFADFVKEKGETKFLGYSEASSEAKVLAIVLNGEFADEISHGEEGMIILAETPFYAEMGGQVGDTGAIQAKEGLFAVTDCQAPCKGLIGHIGRVDKGKIAVGDTAVAFVDTKRRQQIANNHTATHLLHFALGKVLGEHVKQAGSVVDPERFRFDFSHHRPLSFEEIQAIEDLVNEKIRENTPVKAYEISYDDALKQAEIKQFFGEKYGLKVRVIDIDFSKELCGGTHTSDTGNIGYFRIAKESGIAAGVRRIEAVSGREAEHLARKSEDLLRSLSDKLKIQSAKVVERIEKLLEENARLEQEIEKAKKEKAAQLVDASLTKLQMVGGIPFLALEVTALAEEMRFFSEEAAKKVPRGVFFLAAVDSGRIHFLVKVSDDLARQGLKAGDLVKTAAAILGGSGGGRPNLAQGSGTAPEKLFQATEAVKEAIKGQGFNP